MRNVLTRIYIVPYTCISIHNDMNPTQEKSTTQRCKTIESVIIDDGNNEVPIEITYDYSDYYGWDKWELSVWGYDHKIKGTYKPNVSNKVLSELIRDIIRENEEPTHVTFY